MAKSTKFAKAAALLLEEGAPINPSEAQPTDPSVQNLSMDMKVDSYFLKYEKASLPTQQTYAVPGSPEGMMFEFSAFAKSLLEAEGDDPLGGDPGAGDAPMGDPGAGGAEGGEGAPPAAPAEPQIENPRFNVRNFAQSVARLVLNYEGLLDPRTTILNRARYFIEKNYDAGVARQMMEILETQFGLSPRQTTENDGISAPLAAGAWTGVGGGGGG
ncbi:MAG: hypothetical protein E6R04_02005 [Spirochaetes bacterium]|nr:MAG: hypothetical protein E6R04_02005 [Spirochaetota bacterium]